MRFQITVPINAPQAKVFDFLADPANRLLWQSSIKSLDLEARGEPRVGVTWRETIRGGPTFEMAITEMVRPIRWAESLRSRWLTGVVSMDVTERGDETDVQVLVDVVCRGWLRPFDWFGEVLLRRAMRKDLARVSALV